MRKTFILIQNIAIQATAPEEVIEYIDDVRESLDEAVAAIADGSAE